MPHKLPRYKLLLDENFPTSKYFPRLNNRHNVQHLVEDYKQGGIIDRKVYDLAVKEKRIVVTYNDKDFKAFAKFSMDSGIIGVSADLSLEQTDKKLMAFLNKKKPTEVFGKCNHISGETKKAI